MSLVNPLFIILVYLIIGFQYAALTPAWQAPDEPAHYNYIRQIAQTGRLPKLEPGDYDQPYLERLTGEGFPPGLSVDSLEYQDYQPPLYYVLLTPVFLVFDGALLPLRLASLVLGAGVIVFAFLAVREVVGGRTSLPLLAAGFIAFIPQFIAIMASVNNDSLSLLILSLGLWLTLREVAQKKSGRWNFNLESLILGLVLGLTFITKVWAYLLAPVLLTRLLLRWRREGRFPLKQALIIFIPALLIGSLYWGRNWFVCGPADVVCGNWHNQVVVGQPTTPDWIEAHGWWGNEASLLNRFFTFTFDSFWGVFGWMGVFMDKRVYGVLLIFSIGLVVGGIGAMRRWPALTAAQQQGVGLLTFSGLVTLLLYLYYNLSFVQHQGRYLFPALIPIGLGAAAGLWQWAGWGATLIQRLPYVSRFTPQARIILAFAPIVMMAALCLVALYRFVLPAL